MPDVTADNLTAKTLIVERVERPRRGRRWWLRVPLIVVGLVAITLVLAQLLLWTDYPRRIAEAQVGRILNVRASVRAVSIGWLGRTRVEGVALTLPMESEPFLTIDEIRVRHASLPLIAFAQDLSDVAVTGVELVARQDATGRWNVQQLIGGPGPATRPAEPAGPSNPLADVPSFRATDVRASLIRSDGTRLDVDGIEATLDRRDALTADVEARVGDTIRAEGRLGLIASMPHELRLRFANLPPEVAAFAGVTPPSPLSADVRWTGRRTDAGVAGTLRLAEVIAGRAQATGRVDVDAGERVVAEPLGLVVTYGDGKGGAVADVNVEGGRVTYDGGVRFERLRGTANGGRFALDGTADPRTLAADVSADWQQVRRDAIATSGSARVVTSRLFNGKLKLDLTARGGATLPAGTGEGAVTLSGEGAAVDDFRATVGIDPLTWTFADAAQPPVVTPRLNGDVVGSGTAIRVAARSPDGAPTGALTIFGGLETKTGDWWATFDAAALALPELAARGAKGPIDVSLAAAGTPTFVAVRKAYAKYDRGTAYAEGYYDFATPRPLRLSTWAWYDKPVTEDDAAQLNTLSAVGVVDGTVMPLDVAAVADVTGTELVVRGRVIGDVALHVTAAATEQQASVRARDIEALGGTWSLRANWSKAQGWPPVAVASFRNVPLENLGTVVGRPDLGGTIDEGSATILLRSSRLDQLEVDATARGSKLSAGFFRAEALDLVATLRGGAFAVKPTLRESGGTIAAQIDGDVGLTRPVRAAATLTDWPAPYVTSTAAGAERFRPRASGRANAEVSVETGEVTADVALNGLVERGDVRLAGFRLDADVKGKRVTIARATIDTLDGSLAATGAFDLADLNASVLNATFENLTPARLSWSNPALAEVGGRLNGTFSVRPAAGVRPLGPLEVELNVRPEDVAFRGVTLGDTDVLAFAEVPTPGSFRFVTDRAVVNVAGGRVEPFVRVTRDASGGLAQLLTVNFSELDLAQIGRAVDDDGQELVGRLGGRVRVYGFATDLAKVTGDATLELSRSDLANFGPIAALYNALAVGTAGTDPDGEGTIALRVGGGVVTLDDASYFNRGVHASAFGSVRDIDKLPDAALDVVVVGSLQPLRAVKLPFFGDVNDTLAALQSSVTAIEVTGIPQEPRMRQVAIGGLGDTVQKLLLGKTKQPD